MATPVNDFVKAYAQSGTVRFHMPGHKGKSFHGMECYDITEINGADYLYDAQGIIGASEAQTAKAFGTARTLYGTEGSSQCIKTMLGIIKMCSSSDRVTVLAPRNVHKAFIDACILLDLDVKWLYPQKPTASICCADISPQQFEKALGEGGIDCCYVTSPDYLGNMADIKTISQICRKAGIPLIVDNAHGAYTAFLKESCHPIALGADMCCDSAHKTLPCYTGAAYLHISKSAPKEYGEIAKNVMSMFGSTSPSYLLLQSLDMCSERLASGKFAGELEDAVVRVSECKRKLESMGWVLCGQEKLKITLDAANCGYDGNDLADMLREKKIEPEYSDAGYVVFMASAWTQQSELDALMQALESIPVKTAIKQELPAITAAERKMPIRQAALQRYHTVSVDEALGKVCAMTVTACQPSVPVVVSGEVINDEVIKILKRYSIFSVNVL